jgi:hypothetical protein
MELQAKIDERLDQANDQKRKAADEARRADWLREAEEEGLAFFDQETSGVGGPIKGRLFGVEEDWIGRIRLQLQQAIRDRLTPMDPIPSVRVTASLLVDVTRKFINKAREEKEGYVTIIGALENGLPFDARAKSWEKEPSEWQRKLRATIDARLEGDHPLDMIRRVVNQVVADVTREFEEQKENRRAAEEDQESRQSVKAEITRSLRGRLSRDDWADMDEAIDCQFAVLPRGTRRTQLEAACRKAVAPWSQLLEQADKEQRQRDEQDRRRRMREEVIWNTSILKFPFGFPEAKQKAALADVRQALEAANPGDRTVAEQIRDQALQPHLDAHQQQKQTEAAAQEKQRQADGRRSAAERRIDPLLLDAIENAIAAEERDGLELDGPLDRVNFKFEVRDAIRAGLVNRFWTITNLQQVSDKVITAAIEHAARKHILKAVPEE